MYFVGVDSGGTKSAFILTDDGGRVLGRFRGEACTFLGAGKEGVRQMLETGLEALCQETGVSKADIACLGLGISGYGEAPGSEADVLDACEQALAPGKAVAGNDSYVGWAGSLAMEPGINVISGTGSICFGVNERGETARSSGWGAGCDEGSCSWLGRRLVQEFTRQSDGRNARTKLYDMFRAHFNIEDLEDDHYFVMPLNREVMKKPAILQYLLKDMYEAGDPAAAALYDEGARELWIAIEATARALGWEGKNYNVSYSGGLFKAGECALGPLRKYVSEGGATLKAPSFDPEMGTILMAMRHIDPKRDFTGFTFTEE